MLDEISREMHGDVTWCILFAYDMVLIAETMIELNDMLYIWKRMLEENGSRINNVKT